MRSWRIWLTWLLLICAAPPLAAVQPAVALLGIDGAIGPATADHVERGLAHAQRAGAQLVVLQIDTPGGLDTSMRQIVKAILAAPVPVAAYVAPSGARAASAGAYILYASHIAAMAPGTNLGAATPVQIGGAPELPQPGNPDGKAEGAGDAQGSAMSRKQIADAAAYIRGLAQLRGRNVDWAEQAVRKAASLAAAEALEQNVIEIVAVDVPDLLRQLDHRTVKVQGQERQLETAGAPLLVIKPDWRTRFLSVITDPSVALILMMIGIYGVFFEFSSPGFGIAGVAGSICLILALYALQLLPVNYAGLALILLGVALMVAEAFLPSFGVLGLGGIAAFVFGAVILFDTELPGFGVPLGLTVGVAISSALLLAALGGMALKARRRAVVSGAEELIGAAGEVLEDTHWARVHGENWQVTAAAPLRADQKVRVVARKGLVLEVVPAGKESKGE